MTASLQREEGKDDRRQAGAMNTPHAVSDPADFPRRVLLAVSGLSPQIVTETLYALAVRAGRPWIPTEIRLLTTARGAEHARLNLLSNDPGWFHRLRADYGLPEIHFDADGIEIIRDAAGAPLARPLVEDLLCGGPITPPGLRPAVWHTAPWGVVRRQCPNKLVLRRASLLRRRGRSRVQLLAPGEGTARRVWFWARQAAYYRKK